MTEKPEGPLRQKQTPNIILKTCAWTEIVKASLSELMEKGNIKQNADLEFQLRGPPMSLQINELQCLCKKEHHH